jgi:type I restriction enzyme, R subunit
LQASGWAVQDKSGVDHDAAVGIAVREYPTSIGPADYGLFSDRKPLGVVEAKPDSWGAKITTVEDQSGGYAASELKWVKTTEPLPFIYEATGILTRFTDARDPKLVPQDPSDEPADKLLARIGGEIGAPSASRRKLPA